MHLLKILTPLVACALLATPTAPALAQPKGDQVLLDMHQAFRKGERKKRRVAMRLNPGRPIGP